ncbi:acetyl-CoA carboxylase biotin carboxylase subunit [Bacillus andreraoultii]|uniref:acetyl-CoA carboxylase biotin carboxylase subunit n=1 Tax=Bacillus andreraoultii TaxID=1499685 RepID=UPI00053B9FCA|nr:biotin carboxylase N-terminal domain-containing protein [Bacillus andreraoultii]
MRKILIANRGEIAERIIKTCKKLGIETVAIYSDVDKDLPFVKEATVAKNIGPGPVKDSYLQIDRIIQLAKSLEVDAIHPGYGLLSENSEFAKKISQMGMIFIGPKAETLADMGDKVSARKKMKEAGVPVVPGTENVISNMDEAISLADEIGYPVMLKASGGGGGIGMVLCQDEGDLKKAYSSVKSRAEMYFGSDQIFIEKFIEKARHIEVQIFGDQYGNIIHLYERDCSVQRRNQKVVEETPAFRLSEKGKQKLYQYAIKAAKSVSYINAGTIEFIVDTDENCYFLEMNTRLQVEHPVTEEITGIDLVAWQIEVAKGNPIPMKQESIEKNGHAIEFRVYAENPKNFYPSPGTITKLQWGNTKRVRIDKGYVEGNTVTPYYDPMLAKVIFKGATRKECLHNANEFFNTTTIEGIKTNIPVFLDILNDKDFISGIYDTNLLKNLKKGE